MVKEKGKGYWSLEDKNEGDAWVISILQGKKITLFQAE